ncbi:glycosyl transferase family 1 [Bifidobacterium ramosum]|uniref:Glycosyl transferase family 1 n=1 Tax=Bifidobacterium ramosum TaxID=1798158 RepID=A0A6L4X2Q5_9BIFI|nr:glycosyltransferase [Bifidobacterium ramosum]KAB8288024.1 glycosyl transferase family 1 [Bifidobacterium ramosum]NEG72081.1 glycosyltransferase [Bifidobacterium ramosum]
MRVLLVNKFFYHKGGSETYLFALAEGLRAMGHEVAFFAMQHPQNEKTYWDKYFVSEKDYTGNISVIRKVEEAATLAYSPEAKRKFESLLEEFCPDIIHLNLVHRQITFSILDAPYLKTHHVPVVYTAHDYSFLCPVYTMINGRGEVCDDCINGHYFGVLRNTCTKGSKVKSALSFVEAEFIKYRHYYDRIDKIIAPSEFMKRKFCQGGYAERTVMIQNFLTKKQLEIGRKVANHRKFDSSEPYFLFFGRLSKEKGVLTLVSAFLEAIRRLPENWTLHIVGDGPEREAIESVVRMSGSMAAQRIQLLGYKSGEDLQREVGNARFSVLCSEWNENMPYSGLESLAAGTPIIGSQMGGIPELVKEGETGFSYEVRNVASLASVIVDASNIGSAAYVDMQKACMRYAANRSAETYIADLEKQYNQLISK